MSDSVEQSQWKDEVLLMIRDDLAAWLGDDHMKRVPPMFYNDAMRFVVVRSAAEGEAYAEEALRQHGATQP